MNQSASNTFNKARPRSSSLKSLPSSLPPTTASTMFKSSSMGSKVGEKMAAKMIPLEIGSKGTVGSLIRQEIEYFSRLESGCQDSKPKLSCQLADVASTSTSSYVKPKIGSLASSPKNKKKKKKRGSSKLLPSMCSIVDVADSSQSNGFSRYAYRNLKNDVTRLQV